MFTAILSFLGGPAIGSIIGAVTGYFNRKLDVELKKAELEQRKLDREHEIALRRIDTELAAQEAKGKADVAVIEGNAAVEAERMRSIGAAFAADAAGPVDGVDRLRRSVRPVLSYLLTLGAMAVNGVLLWRLGAVWADIDAQARQELLVVGVTWVLTQASAVISFWFVSRPSDLAQARR